MVKVLAIELVTEHNNAILTLLPFKPEQRNAEISQLEFDAFIEGDCLTSHHAIRCKNNNPTTQAPDPTQPPSAKLLRHQPASWNSSQHTTITNPLNNQPVSSDQTSTLFKLLPPSCSSVTTTEWSLLNLC